MGWVKTIAIGAGGVVLLAGLFVGWNMSKAHKMLAEDYSYVKGKDLPLPQPLPPATAAAAAQNAEADGTKAEEAHAMEGTLAGMHDEVEELPMEPPADPYAEALERGRYLYTVRLGCIECHGPDGSGRLVADALPVIRMAGSNITTGEGGLPEDHPVSDFDLIIRHGINHKGKASIMPAVDFQKLSDQELVDVVTYVKSLPPVDKVSDTPAMYGPVGKVLLAQGKLFQAADVIDHDYVHPAAPPPASDTLAYGEHLAQTCVGCHGLHFSGGPINGGDPSWPEAANLTPDATGTEGMTFEQFQAALQKGIRRDGTQMAPVMPVATFSKIPEPEVRAIYTYLMSLDPRPKGE